MIKKFSDIKGSTDPKAVRAKMVSSFASTGRSIQATMDQVDKTINKVHKAFGDVKRVFTPVQVKKAIVSFGKMDRVLSGLLKKTNSILRRTTKADISNDKISTQLEDLHTLKAKLAILCAQSMGSLGEEFDDFEDEEFVELDESGYVVDEIDPVEEIIEEEPMVDEEATVDEEVVEDETTVDETAADETATDEVVAEDETAVLGEEATDEVVADETATDEVVAEDEIASEDTTAGEDLVDDDIVEDVIEDVIEDVVDEEVIEDVIEDELEELDIELEDSGIDEALAGEIFGQDEEFMDIDDVDEEIEATASLKDKKIASAKRTLGNSGLAEDGLLSSLMEQELTL